MTPLSSPFEVSLREIIPDKKQRTGMLARVTETRIANLLVF